MNLSSIFDWMDLLIFVLAILGTIGVVYAGFQLYHEGNTPQVPAPATTNKNQQPFPPANKPSIPTPGKAKKPINKPPPEKLIPDVFVDKVLEQALEKELAQKAKKPIQKIEVKEEPKKKLGYANPEESKKKRSLFSFLKKSKDNNQAELLGNIMPPAAKPAQKKEPLSAPVRKQVYPSPELIPEKLTLRSPESINLVLKVKGNKLIYRKISQGSYNELKIKYQPTLNKSEVRKNEYPTGNSLVFSINGDKVITKTYQFTIFYGDMAGNVFSQQVAGLGREYPIVDKPVKVS